MHRYGCTRYASPKYLSIRRLFAHLWQHYHHHHQYFLVLKAPRTTLWFCFSWQFFPYFLLLLAFLVYIPALFWRFNAAPHLSCDLNFIMDELDRFYNRAIKLAKNLVREDRKDCPGGSWRWPQLLLAFTSQVVTEHFSQLLRTLQLCLNMHSYIHGHVGALKGRNMSVWWQLG